ncbi:MAG: PhoH family protein [Raineya sp.]
MIEKTITLENISLVDFLGAENLHIKKLASAFPTTKILSRGNEIRIQGQAPDILKINGIINDLIKHYNKFGKITEQNIEEYILQSGKENHTDEGNIEKIREEVILYGTKGFGIKPRTQNQAQIVKASLENDLVFALGPAGTGKTYVAVALAVQALKNKQIKKIIITRPAVEAGENLGFLPGDLKEKVDPYLRPIYDALDDMIPSEKLKFYLENRIIEIAPLAYMRGRTLNDAFILLDEAQNTTPMQMKMFLTRMGANSKAIVTGDQSQIDLPSKQRSGLIDALHVLKNVEGIAIVELDAKDVVRHRLVKAIIQAYEKAEQKI